MVTVTKETNGNTTIVKLSGTIDEADDLGKLLGQPTGPLIVSCKQITRINSVGVKNWIKYFSGLQQKKIAITFEDFAAALVEQVNTVQNFTCGGTITSVIVPFLCAGCNSNLIGTLKTEDIKKAGFQVPAIKCPKCGGKAEFDDIPEEYFSFLQK